MPNKLNLVGKVYGDLVVLYEGPALFKTHVTSWVCQCKCGNTPTFPTGRLSHGLVLHCGCQKTSHNKSNLIGQRFGYLEVVASAKSQYRGGQKYAAWLCKCHACGNSKEIVGHDLKSGRVVACGCKISSSGTLKRKNEIGKVYGRLTVLCIDEEKMKSRPEYNTSLYWRCKCECGNETTVSGNSLRRKITASCGCYKKEMGDINIQNQISNGTKYCPEERSMRYVFHGSYDDGDLTFEQFFKLSQKNCTYCGLHPVNLTHGFRHNGLDRVNSKGKHDLGNVVPCCKYCNWYKKDLTLEKFQENINRLTGFQQRKILKDPHKSPLSDEWIS